MACPKFNEEYLKFRNRHTRNLKVYAEEYNVSFKATTDPAEREALWDEYAEKCRHSWYTMRQAVRFLYERHKMRRPIFNSYDGPRTMKHRRRAAMIEINKARRLAKKVVKTCDEIRAKVVKT